MFLEMYMYMTVNELSSVWMCLTRYCWYESKSYRERSYRYLDLSGLIFNTFLWKITLANLAFKNLVNKSMISFTCWKISIFLPLQSLYHFFSISVYMSLVDFLHDAKMISTAAVEIFVFWCTVWQVESH